MTALVEVREGVATTSPCAAGLSGRLSAIEARLAAGGWMDKA